MTIAIAGGSGNVGRRIEAQLRASGERVRIISRRPRPVGVPLTSEWAMVDYRSGAGLADATAGPRFCRRREPDPRARRWHTDLRRVSRVTDGGAGADRRRDTVRVCTP